MTQNGHITPTPGILWKHWLAYTLSLVAIIVCAYLLLLESGSGSRDCFGRLKEAASTGLFDCKLTLDGDPLKNYGASLALVGLVYWVAFAIALQVQLFCTSPAFTKSLRAISSLAALSTFGLIAWQYSTIGKLCPLCLTDAILALAVALLLFFIPRSIHPNPKAWLPYQLSLFLAAIFGAIVYLQWNRQPTPEPVATIPTTKEVWPEELSQIEQPAEEAIEAIPTKAVEKVISPTEELAPEESKETTSETITSQEPEETSSAPTADKTKPAKEIISPCVYHLSMEDFPKLDSFFSQGDHIEGDLDAPIQLTVFFDPSCGSCGDLHWELERVKVAFERNRMSNRIAIRSIPLRLYKNTMPATQALWLLRGKPGFSKLKNRLASGEIERIDSIGKLKTLLEELKINAEPIIAQVRAGAGKQEIIDTTHATIEAGLTSLPRLFINNKQVPQNPRGRTADCLTRTILSELASE